MFRVLILCSSYPSSSLTFYNNRSHVLVILHSHPVAPLDYSWSSLVPYSPFQVHLSSGLAPTGKIPRTETRCCYKSLRRILRSQEQHFLCQSLSSTARPLWSVVPLASYERKLNDRRTHCANLARPAACLRYHSPLHVRLGLATRCFDADLR